MFRKRIKLGKARKIWLRAWSVGLILALIIGMVSVSPRAQGASAPPSVSAKAAVLIHGDTGEVLFAKNEKERLSMASTTKIMTSLLALEQAAVSNPEITLTPGKWSRWKGHPWD